MMEWSDRIGEVHSYAIIINACSIINRVENGFTLTEKGSSGLNRVSEAD